MIKIGLIGCGDWGKNLLRNFANMPGCVLLSCCDENPKQIERLCPNYPGVEFTKDPKEIIGNTNLDAVVISTPPASHFGLSKAAILADKDVFVEKPMVLKVKEGEELVGLAEEKKRILMVGHIMEYHAATLKLKEYIDKGELGKIYYLYATRVNLGKLRDIENALWSFAPHDISMILFLLEKDPISVTPQANVIFKKGSRTLFL
jgi:UDP-2-acetamido-3-amino-2,3-dideoxy-glucuronate N-acetyltransferase